MAYDLPPQSIQQQADAQRISEAQDLAKAQQEQIRKRQEEEQAKILAEQRERTGGY